MYKHIDADYYGFRDEEDGILLPAEAAAEKALQAEVGDAVGVMLSSPLTSSHACCRLGPSTVHTCCCLGRMPCNPCW